MCVKKVTFRKKTHEHTQCNGHRCTTNSNNMNMAQKQEQCGGHCCVCDLKIMSHVFLWMKAKTLTQLYGR